MSRNRRAQDLVFTLFGDILMHRGGPIWVGTIIRLLQPFGLSEGAARTVLSRMARKGWLSTERQGRNSYYQLTSKGRKLLQEGEDRIYHPQWRDAWDGRWLLVTYTVPEDMRHLRDRLRDRLTWLGFGSLGNGLWISPGDLRDEVAEIAESLDTTDYLECFYGEAVAFTDTDRLVSRCWDLAGINHRYEEFISEYVPIFDRCRIDIGRGALTPEAAYGLRLKLINEYRIFPLLDPFLPGALLPKNWAGQCAAHLFRVFHDLLADLSERHVDAVQAAAPARRVSAPEAVEQ